MHYFRIFLVIVMLEGLIGAGILEDWWKGFAVMVLAGIFYLGDVLLDR